MYKYERWSIERLSTEELMLSNCGAGKDSCSSLDSKEVKSVNLKGNKPWIFLGRTDARAEAPILWPPDTKNWLIGKLPNTEQLKARGEGGDREWDGWIALVTQQMCVWAKSERYWRAAKAGMLQSMGLQRVKQDWATEQQQTQEKLFLYLSNMVVYYLVTNFCLMLVDRIKSV